MTDSTEPMLSFDGKDYKVSELSKEAVAELTSMRVAEQQIAQLKAKVAIATTARNAYRNALIEMLPRQTQ